MNPTAALLRTTLNAASLIAPRLAGQAVFALFAHPAGRAGVRPAERELTAQAHVGRLTVSGKKVVTYRWGSGERPVLLVHGWQSRGSHLGYFISALREKGYSPVAFDAPGHGDSGGRGTTILEYREIMRQLHSEYGTFEAVVAHSFGVMASFFALRGAIRSNRLVAIGGVAEFDYLIDQFCGGLGLRPRLKQELRRRVEGLLFPGEQKTWRRFSATYRPDEIRIPLLVIHDEDDDVVAVGQAHRIAAAYREQADVFITRGLGHRRILGDPEAVASALDFVTIGEEAGRR